MPGAGYIEACSSAVSIHGTNTSMAVALLMNLTIPAPLVIVANAALLLKTMISETGAVEVSSFSGGRRQIHAKCQAGCPGKDRCQDSPFKGRLKTSGGFYLYFLMYFGGQFFRVEHGS